MEVLIIGGGLQGVEVSFLAKKAKWNVSLVDKKKDVAAKNLAATFYCLDVFSKEFEELITSFNLLIPALENKKALEHLVFLAEKYNTVLAFDYEAYKISSEKILSKQFFLKNNISTPNNFNFSTKNIKENKWPQIAKPSVGSGSQGVSIFNNLKEFTAWASLKEKKEINWEKNWVIEEYVPGPMYSIEIVGTPHNYILGEVVFLGMDAVYDCNKVVFPSNLNLNEIATIEKIAKKIATNLNLKGLMDLELIKHENEFLALEIDARFPSQTPITVYYATGQNLLEDLAACFLNLEKQYLSGLLKDKQDRKQKFVVYEHLSSLNGKLFSPGEGLMGTLGPLVKIDNFFTAQFALIGGEFNKEPWGATLVFVADNLADLENKRKTCQEMLAQAYNLKL